MVISRAATMESSITMKRTSGCWVWALMRGVSVYHSFVPFFSNSANGWWDCCILWMAGASVVGSTFGCSFTKPM